MSKTMRESIKMCRKIVIILKTTFILTNVLILAKQNPEYPGRRQNVINFKYLKK